MIRSKTADHTTMLHRRGLASPAAIELASHTYLLRGEGAANSSCGADRPECDGSPRRPRGHGAPSNRQIMTEVRQKNGRSEGEKARIPHLSDKVAADTTFV